MVANYYWLVAVNASGIEATSVPLSVVPLELVFSASSFPEDTTVGAVVAALSVVGLPGGVTVSSYAITADPDGMFQIDGSNLELAAPADYETDTSHSVTVEATLSTAATVEGTQVFTVTDVSLTLNALSLSASTIAEGAATGTLVGAVQNLTTGSTLSITDTAGTRFALDGTNIEAGATPTDYEASTSHNITLREVHPEATNTPRDTVIPITVTNVFDAATLNALTLDTPTIEEATAAGVLVGTLQDVTGGSTLSLIDDAGGRFALDGNTIETGATATDYDLATSHNITVRETLADSPNSPRDSVIAISVTALPAFSPADLSPDAWYDPSDLSTLFQDAARTVAVTTDGDVVGSIMDKSGNGYHLTQATTANKFIYKTDGTLHWLQGDLTDDLMQSGTYVLSLPHFMIAALSKGGNGSYRTFAVGLSTNTHSFESVGSADRLSAYLRMASGSVNQALSASSAWPSGTVKVAESQVTPGTSITFLTNGTSVSAATAYSAQTENLTVVLRFAGKFYGGVTKKSQVAAGDATDLRGWLAAKAGL